MRLLLILMLFLTFSCTSVTTKTGPETRIKIAIVDSGVNLTPDLVPFSCRDGNISFDALGWNVDLMGHGTRVFELVAKDLDPEKYCVVMLKPQQNPMGGFDPNPAMYMLLAVNPQYLNLSFISRSDPDFLKIFQSLIENGTHIFVAAGNDRENLNYTEVYMAEYAKILDLRFFHVVGSINGEYSNYGDTIEFMVNGDYSGWNGTSFASPRALNMFIKGELKGKTENPNANVVPKTGEQKTEDKE